MGGYFVEGAVDVVGTFEDIVSPVFQGLFAAGPAYEPFCFRAS
jgi:hypothetical protein